MGFSFHDASSMVEAAGSLRFAPTNDSNPISETGSTSNVDQERRDDNDLQFEFKPSIKGEMVWKGSEADKQEVRIWVSKIQNWLYELWWFPNWENPSIDHSILGNLLDLLWQTCQSMSRRLHWVEGKVIQWRMLHPFMNPFTFRMHLRGESTAV